MLSAHGRSVEIGWDDDEDHIPRRIAAEGDFYERALLDDCYERALPGMVVDAGAHIGNHTLWFAGIMGRQVVAFEPRHESFARLGLNVGKNRLWGQVKLYHAALGDHRASCRVTDGGDNTGSCEVVLDEGDIPVYVLDDLNLMPAVVKIDVEGSAMAVLRGGLGTIERCKPLLYVETGAQTDAVDAMLTTLGYSHRGCLGATPTHIYA